MLKRILYFLFHEEMDLIHKHFLNLALLIKKLKGHTDFVASECSFMKFQEG